MRYRAEKIYKRPRTEGCYGNRYVVPITLAHLIWMFNSMSLHKHDYETIEGRLHVVYEFPEDMDLESNPLIMYWINYFNTKIIEE